MKKLFVYLLLLLPLAIASCGGDDKDEPSPSPNQGNAQVFQLSKQDTFILDGVQFNWNSNASFGNSAITSSANLKFYSTGKSNINEVKIPDVDIRLWKDWANEAALLSGGTIMAVEKSSGNYNYYCIFCKVITDAGSLILGNELTIYRMK